MVPRSLATKPKRIRRTIDICAPGQSIKSSWSGTSAGVISKTGTSMAAPIVAATAGFMRAVNKDMSADLIEYVLEETADDLYTTGWDEYTGYGRVNVGYAVQVVKMYAYLNTDVSKVDVVAKCCIGIGIDLSIEIAPLTEYYVIERAESLSGPYQVINNHVGFDTIENGRVFFRDTDVELGKTYYYRVVDYIDAYSSELGYCIPYSRYSDGTLVAEIYSIEPVTIYNYENTVRWVNDNGYAGFYILRSTIPDEGFNIIARTQGSQYIDSNVEAGNTYYYQVVAFVNTENGLVFTSASNVVSITY